MKDSTKIRIAEAIEILHYHPNQLARSLRNGRSGVVAVTLPDIRNPFFSSFYYLMQTVCNVNGLTPLLIHAMSDQEVSSAISLLKSGFLDGVICSDDGWFVKRILASGISIPIVMISPNPDIPVSAGIIMDLETGMTKLCEHLEDQHVRSVGYIGSRNDYSSIHKLQGIRTFCTDHVLTIDEDAVVESSREDIDSYTDGYNSCAQLLQNVNDLPDAIVCASDIIAMGAIKCLSHNNIRIPEDVLLCGHDDTEIAVMNAPSLTSVHIPLKEICEMAVNTLFRIIQGENVEPLRIETGLSIRTSTMSAKNVRICSRETKPDRRET